ncbi:MAG: flagellar basal body P-ring formation chaperone FlgA [Pseudomonadota bacterium]
MAGTTRKRNSRIGRMVRALALAAVLVAGTATMPGAGTSPVADNDWKLLVRSVACVRGPDVLLGEIADPVGSIDQRTWEAVRNVKLWKASDRLGRPVTIDRDKLLGVLRYYMGDVVRNLVLPSQLTVQTGGTVVSGEELETAVVAFLTPRARDLSEDFEFRNLRLPLHYFFPNDYDTLSVELDGDLKPGSNQIRLRGVSPDGRTLSTKAGSVFVDVWKAVPVAAKPLNRFERLSRENITFMRMNLAYNQELWDGMGGPWRMARPLGRNQPFSMAHLERVPPIEKGDVVTLVYQGKRVQLTMKAEALADADMGQQVSVRNMQSNKVIVATVVDNETVVVR